MFGPKRHAEWERGTDCSHLHTSFRIITIRWLRVPIASRSLTVAAEVGRWVAGIATLGLTAVVKGGLKDLSHECIEVEYTCERCSSGNLQKFTAEILRMDKEGGGETLFTCGHYRKVKGTRRTFKPESMTVEDVERSFGEMGSRYYLCTENCYHWSRTLWNKLERMERNFVI